MALNIKNSEVESLAAEVARLAKETKTEAIRRALLDRKLRLQARRGNISRKARMEALLREQIWPQIPARLRGTRLSRAEREQILGYGSEGV
ncbi:MAG TPA: type II toxin-antitoxin system VapB family antitoxin [Bryobacteraceae bacterium]|nr:type II toxin-antitoxin system VapB family antitoxin [Bryobacteraceae bacterium]